MPSREIHNYITMTKKNKELNVEVETQEIAESNKSPFFFPIQGETVNATTQEEAKEILSKKLSNHK